MSIDVFASWRDGRTESEYIAPQSVAREWAVVANRLGLKLYDDAFPIYFSPANVDQLISELVMIRDVLAAEKGVISGLDKLLAFLERIKHREGWDGSLG